MVVVVSQTECNKQQVTKSDCILRKRYADNVKDSENVRLCVVSIPMSPSNSVWRKFEMVLADCRD